MRPLRPLHLAVACPRSWPNQRYPEGNSLHPQFISSRMTDSGRFERRQAAPSMNLIANRNVK
jgi:hypothetical protein